MQHKHVVLSALVAAFILTGCGKGHDDHNTAVTVPGPVPVEKAPAKTEPATPNTVAYYSAHLDKAKETWHECQKVADKDATPEIIERCTAARTAWEFQPYKPKGHK